MTPKRRAYGSGGLHKRKDGLWIGTINAGWTETGKRRVLTVSSKERAVAEWKLEELRKRLIREAAANKKEKP